MDRASEQISRALTTLELTQAPDRATVRAAFRRIVWRAHPDAGGWSRSLDRLIAARDLLLEQLPADSRERQNDLSVHLHLVQRPVVNTTRATPAFERPTLRADGRPRWSGADWTGAASGEIWEPSGGDGGDPRRHGRARR